MLTQEQVEDSIYLHRAGFSIREVAVCFDVSTGTMLRALSKRNESKTTRVARNTRCIVSMAISKGTLIPTNTCEVCKRVYEPVAGVRQIIGHHDDYNKPLDVRWLCNGCHRFWHVSNVAKGRLRTATFIKVYNIFVAPHSI